ncbi:fluoride efflux transporter CrcB [Lederbergia citrea]|uniref:Fluoride-specific ion channel FluC n=1 Tax=Lederbergia citrea TaxID=2833581 RepID=A0A942UPS7_9BACI|nr:fluoride efflux transporter CrcB [Lederbergia citrea]MBS4221824.1 fluoride efflux transporter CrcB [Lederbergia citrea]
MNLLAVGLGGVVGSLLRYFISTLSFGASDQLFPFHTLLVNLIGSYFLGILTGLNKRIPYIPTYISAAIGTGLIGSFTTFSTFSTEVVKLLQDHYYFMAFSYIIISFLGGLVLAAFGYIQGAGRKGKKVVNI